MDRSSSGRDRRPASWIAALALSLAVGCGGGDKPAPTAKTGKPGAKPAATAPAQVEAPAAAVPVPVALPADEGFVYDPQNRRDPFRSILVTTDASRKVETLPPLLRTELRDLKLIAVVWGGFGYSAMVQTPDGKGYTLRVGTPVGTNNGVVKRIVQDRVSVEEKFVDIFGENKVREVVLDLHPPKEGSE